MQLEQPTSSPKAIFVKNESSHDCCQSVRIFSCKLDFKRKCLRLVWGEKKGLGEWVIIQYLDRCNSRQTGCESTDWSSSHCIHNDSEEKFPSTDNKDMDRRWQDGGKHLCNESLGGCSMGPASHKSAGSSHDCCRPIRGCKGWESPLYCPAQVHLCSGLQL